MRILSFLAAVALLFATSPLAPAQVVSGQVDTFESGTTLNWANGAPAADPTVQLGGPGGALDHYLRIATNGVGGGAGSLMIAFNRIQCSAIRNHHSNIDISALSNGIHILELTSDKNIIRRKFIKQQNIR